MLHSSKLKCHVASGPVLVQNTLFGILIDFKEGSQYSLVAISQKEQANSGSILSFFNAVDINSFALGGALLYQSTSR